MDQNVVSAGMHHTTIFDSQESFAKATPKTAETPIALIQKIISYLYHFLTTVTDSQGNESLKKIVCLTILPLPPKQMTI